MCCTKACLTSGVITLDKAFATLPTTDISSPFAPLRLLSRNAPVHSDYRMIARPDAVARISIHMVMNFEPVRTYCTWGDESQGFRNTNVDNMDAFLYHMRGAQGKRHHVHAGAARDTYFERLVDHYEQSWAAVVQRSGAVRRMLLIRKDLSTFSRSPQFQQQLNRR